VDGDCWEGAFCLGAGAVLDRDRHWQPGLAAPPGPGADPAPAALPRPPARPPLLKPLLRPLPLSLLLPAHRKQAADPPDPATPQIRALPPGLQLYLACPAQLCVARCMDCAVGGCLCGCEGVGFGRVRQDGGGVGQPPPGLFHGRPAPASIRPDLSSKPPQHNPRPPLLLPLSPDLSPTNNRPHPHPGVDPGFGPFHEQLVQGKIVLGVCF
jgi:hypothetical protein